jgi:hypothetical protein
MVLARFSWRDHVLRIMITVVRDGEIMIMNVAWMGMQKRGRTWWWAPSFGLFVRRRPTLPHSVGCSTIGAGGLSFRVRNGSGRFPAAMAAVTLYNCQHRVPPWWGGCSLSVSCTVDADVFVVKSSAY